MLFNSLHFIVFLPIVVFVYFILPSRIRYLWLLGASYYFYMCWNPQYALLMLLSTAITFASGFFIARLRAKHPGWCKAIVGISFCSNLGILILFKYAPFITQNVNALLAAVHIAPIPFHFDLLLPVGISFYTFQALSYTMDVYRGDISAEPNFFRYALFVSFFPQLVAGPIERSKDLLIQLRKEGKFKYQNFLEGTALMLWGFFLKMVIADRLAIFVDQVYNNVDRASGTQLIIGTVLFAFQIYCDFGGYSTIAMGVARIFDIRLVDNFNTPYFSFSIAEFWRRWHITLSAWFRDYLYIPLGGNQKGKFRKYLNILIVFLVSGLWHGASWHFVIWGVLNGVYQVMGEILIPFKNACLRLLHIRRGGMIHRILATGFTFSLVLVTWVFFRANSLTEAMLVFNKAIHFSPSSNWGILLWLAERPHDWYVLLISLLFLFCHSVMQYRGRSLAISAAHMHPALRWICAFVMIWIVLIFGIYGGTYDSSAFIYFQF